MGWIIAFSIVSTLLIVTLIGFGIFYKIKNKNNHELLNKNDDSNIKESLNNLSNKTDGNFEYLKELVKDINNKTSQLQNIGDSVGKLNQIFLNNQMRGRAGEIGLKELLNDLFGITGIVQYQVSLPVDTNKSNFGRADALIKISEGNHNQYILIDSKFPVDNYQKLVEAKDDVSIQNAKNDLKQNIKKQINECKKYIGSNGIEYTILYIPSDAIFQKIIEIMAEDIIQEIYNKKVWIVSPTTLYPLISIIITMKKQQYQLQHASKIIKMLQSFSEEFKKLNDRWLEIENKTKSQNKAIDNFSITVQKINKKFIDITKPSFNKKIEMINKNADVQEVMIIDEND